jgi:hypothetical protein
VSTGLGEQRGGLCLERLHGVGAGCEAGGRLLEHGKLHEGVGELGGVATLLSIHALPGSNDLPGSLGVVVNDGLSELLLRSSVRKKPGSTSIVRIPKPAISGASDSIHPSMPNFAAAYAVQNVWPAMPAVEEMVSSRPDRCLRITGRMARVTFIGPNSSVSI